MAVAPLIVAAVLWLGSATLFWLGARALRLRLAMRHWPRVRGIVKDHTIRSSNPHGTGHHRAIVTVEYAFDGKKRRVSCDSPTRLSFATKRAAASTIAGVRIGGPVDIYVDPLDGTRAFLLLPEVSAMVLLFGGSLFLLVVGIGIFNGRA